MDKIEFVRINFCLTGNVRLYFGFVGKLRGNF